MNQIFQTKKTLKFREADPAGIMFFGNISAFAHDAFEEFIIAAGYKYEEWFSEKQFFIPIRHSEANFLAPLAPGQTYDIHVSLAKLGDSSFQMKYVFSSTKVHAIVTMVHVVIDATSMTKINLPPLMRTRLQPYLEAKEQGTN